MKNASARECIELIIPLCELDAARVEGYGMSKESVANNVDHLDLLLMPIFQIGELVGSGNYYDALQEAYPSDTWSQAYGMRNRIAHGYAKVNPAIVWETATVSIPELRSLCESLLSG